MIPLMVVCLMANRFSDDVGWLAINYWLALIIFIAASITDAFDGHLARKHNLVTNFGKLMDPLADKLLVLSAFIGLVELGIFPAWLVVIILFRELLVTGLRTLAAAQSRIIQANNWGKNKTVSQMAAIITAMALLAIENTLRYYGKWESGTVYEAAGQYFIYAMLAMCLLTSVVSGYMYMASNRDIMLDMK